MKNILLLITLCLYLSGCKNNDDDCNCESPEWVKTELRYYEEKSPPSLGMVYYIKKDGMDYYGIMDGADSTLTTTLRLFNADGSLVNKDDEIYDILLQLFLDGEFTLCNP